jgi:hypothetical protein
MMPDNSFSWFVAYQKGSFLTQFEYYIKRITELKFLRTMKTLVLQLERA